MHTRRERRVGKMSRILVTGSSGFIGSALAKSIARNTAYELVCLSRSPTGVPGATNLQGDFSDPNALHMLDSFEGIDILIHLAAVTGGCTEEDGLRVNVAGTHRLLRYLIDRGCRKFVLASSIAAVGMQSVDFRPLQLPMPDEHPCFDRDGYGFSKYMMEEVTRYLSRQNGFLDFINLRLASIAPDERQLTPAEPGPVPTWGMGKISVMFLSDTVRCLMAAAEAPFKPGVRILNAVGSQACAAVPVPELLRSWYGGDADAIDFSHYEQPGREKDPVYDISRIREELGFVPQQPILGD
ncbi:MAG: NAD(P)-dependent oxidoreductase [Caldilineaceae bacterium SB0665_bin_25]|nr:NAD(P)-dependent oxidoreductase [Caldilineaceae bacterium SB0665_bin_25]